jgi:outer membrane beta-barrel protein
MKASFWHFVALLFLFSSSSVASAQDLSPEQLRGVDANKPVAVLQKRFFEKRLRPEVGLLVGSMLDEAYLNTSLSGVRIGLFFSEWFGLESQYIDTSVTLSDDRKALTELVFLDPEDTDKRVSPNPETNAIRGILDATFVVAPFYGKSNFFDWFIVYTDMYFAVGGTQVSTDQGDLTGAILSFGQRFYFTKSFSMRLDFRDRIYTEKRGGKDSTKNALSYDIGLSFFFL